MKTKRLNVSFSAVVAIAVGLVILLGYFIRLPVLDNLRLILLEWAVVLAAIALWVGIFNLWRVHWRKMTKGPTGKFDSAILVLSLLITLGVTLWFGPSGGWSLWIFRYIQVPIESSLMAILSVILAYACARLLRRRANLLSSELLFRIVFVATVVIVLLATGPLFGFNLPGLAELRAWIAQVPATAGARGILLGVALGTIATGLRVLMGADRPYGG
jgi:hypothetical protein